MKQLKVLAICCLSMLIMEACESGSNKSNSSVSSTSNIKEETNQQSVDLNYQKACEDLEFVKAHQIVKNLRNEALENGIDKWKKKKRYYSKYEVADIYVFNEEASYLLSLDDPLSEKRILKLILETSIDGAPTNEGQCKYGVAFNILNSADEAGVYARGLSRFNRKCDIAMDLAIVFKNQSLAKSVLVLYKDELHAVLGDNYSGRKEAVANVRGKKIMVGNEGYAWYESNSKNAAQKKYNEAVKNGVFK